MAIGPGGKRICCTSAAPFPLLVHCPQSVADLVQRQSQQAELPVDHPYRPVLDAYAIHQIACAEIMLAAHAHDRVVADCELGPDLRHALVVGWWAAILTAEDDKGRRPDIEAVAMQRRMTANNTGEPLPRIVLLPRQTARIVFVGAPAKQQPSEREAG